LEGRDEISLETTPDAITHLRVPGKAGPVPLSAVADLTLGGGSAQINRLGRRRVTSQKLRAASIIIPPSRSRGVRSLGFQP